MEKAYCRYPHLNEDKLVFLARDQIWLASVTGGDAHAVTSSKGQKAHPFFSPDGKTIAFTSAASGRSEVHLVDVGGGEDRQVTDFGANLRTVGWSRGKILVASNRLRPFGNFLGLEEVALDGTAQAFPVGPAVFLAQHPRLGRVICRYEFLEASSWKRYRGGSKGDLWIDRSGRGQFEPLLGLDGNLSRPHWLGDRLFFLSDHEGCGNLYSCSASGGDLERHSDSSEFYVRHLSGDEKNLVYSCGADLHLFDGKTRKIEIGLPPLAKGWSLRREPLEGALQELAVSNSRVALVSRGHLLVSSSDEELKQYSRADSPPMRLARWQGDALFAFREREGREHAVIFFEDQEREIDCGGLGRVVAFEPRPGFFGKAAVSNQRLEVMLADLATGEFRVIDRSEVDAIGEIAWSHDGHTLAYSIAITPYQSEIRVFDTETGKITPVQSTGLRDRTPSFDPTGRALYFLSERSLQSMPGELGSPCGFGPAWQPCRLTLDTFALEVLPLPPGEYPSLWAAADSVLYVDKRRDGNSAQVALYRWAEAAREETRLLDAISMAQASPDGSVVAYLRDSRIERLGGGKALSLRDAGVTFDAQLEWDSLFHLAWSLQRDFFWDADRVTGDAWLAKRELYRPLTSCLATRGDCSDLLWQLNGELETSHSYEFRRDDDQAAGEEKAKAFAAETVAKYGEWQANNRALAARLSSGRIGYVHLPSTQPAGYAEFHRQFLREHGKDALILDLRYCAGGNLGEFVLDRLVRRRLGRTKTRGLREEPYPPLSGPARLAVLINGFCGSDGEMLAQAIRTLGMALVFGTPSWGGVTGAKGRTDIVGGGYLSQPRTVFQIENAPRIENRGVIPDKHVEFRPQDYESGIDPQLELAVRELAIWSS